MCSLAPWQDTPFLLRKIHMLTMLAAATPSNAIGTCQLSLTIYVACQCDYTALHWWYTSSTHIRGLMVVEFRQVYLQLQFFPYFGFLMPIKLTSYVRIVIEWPLISLDPGLQKGMQRLSESIIRDCQTSKSLEHHLFFW